MASHILDEVEKVCTHVAIIQKGVLKTSGPVSDVLNTSADSSTTILISADDNQTLRSVISNMPGINSVIAQDNLLVLSCNESVTSSAINRYCFEKGITLNQLLLKRKTLETRFLEITGGQSDR